MAEQILSFPGKALSVLVKILLFLNPVRIITSTLDGIDVLRRHRRLALAMAQRELTTRYAGQALGTFWVIGHPLFQMMVYLLIFGVVFKVKMESSLEMPRDYTIYILSGLVPWLSIAPAIGSAPVSIVSNTTLVKQFTFEIEVLPIKDVLIAMLFWVIGVAIIVLYTLVIYRALPWTYLLLPYLLGVQLLLLIGCAWFLSAVSVFFRDLKDVVTVLITMGVYVLPVVYLPNWVPAIFRPFVYANPFSSIIWMYQDALYYGRLEHPFAWVVGTLFAVVTFSGGHRVFQRLRPMFGAAL